MKMIITRELNTVQIASGTIVENPEFGCPESAQNDVCAMISSVAAIAAPMFTTRSSFRRELPNFSEHVTTAMHASNIGMNSRSLALMALPAVMWWMMLYLGDCYKGKYGYYQFK